MAYRAGKQYLLRALVGGILSGRRRVSQLIDRPDLFHDRDRICRHGRFPDPGSDLRPTIDQDMLAALCMTRRSDC